jgi:hypothetical protein
MIGGLTTWPLSKSTGPGTSMPTPNTSAAVRPAPASNSANIVSAAVSTGSGPVATSIVRCRSASTSPRRSHSAVRMPVAPMSATSSTPRAWWNVKRLAGRPPVGAPSPLGTTRAALSSASRRWLTVDRDRPVSCMTSALVRLGRLRNS